MSGWHHHPTDHHPTDHHRRGPFAAPTRSRRAFLGEVGGGALALALLSPVLLSACSSDTANDGDQADPDDTSLRWARTNLGFVSAYVLVRGNRAAIVDTGTEGSADAIGQSLQDLGLTYNDVEDLILTHHHGDHAGSIGEVSRRAINAAIHAGEADLSSIGADGLGDISPLVGGEDVFGFEMVATPGHTAGHMAAIDHAAGLLIAGDALFTEAGAVTEAPERFTSDIDLSRDSIRSLADLTFNTLLVGHGEPIEAEADRAVQQLADSL